MSRKVLNFAPIKFAEESKEFGLYQIHCVSKEQLNQLRAEHYGTNTFFQFGNTIFHSPMVAEGGYRDGKQGKFHVGRDIRHTRKMIHEVLFRFMLSRPTPVRLRSFRNVEFLSINPKHDLIREILPDHLKDRISYKLGFRFDVRTLNQNEAMKYGIVLNTFHEWGIQVNCKELYEAGLDLRGKYVTILLSNYSELAPKHFLKGRVKSVDGLVAKVDKEGTFQDYPLESLFLENHHGNRKELLEVLSSGKVANEVLGHLRDHRGDIGSLPVFLRDVSQTHNFLMGEQLSNQNGLIFNIEKFLGEDDHQWKGTRIGDPVYYFNSGQDERHTSREFGLRKFGPHSKTKEMLQNPVILVFFRARSEGRVDSFLKKLVRGMPETVNKNNYRPFEFGFAAKYRLNEIQLIRYKVSNGTLTEYKAAMMKAYAEYPNASLAIVETAEQWKALPDEENPYIFCKSILLGFGIPSQEFRFETMELPNWQLANVLNNACLAMYAKMGGVPWKIPREPGIQDEVVIGIGNKVFKKRRFGGGTRYVGITTAFASDGEYLLGNRSRAVSFNEYAAIFKQLLQQDLDEIKQRRGWKKGESIRLIFHVFKPFSSTEIDAVQEVVGEVGMEFDVQYSFITFYDDHPWLMLDFDQPGIDDFNYPGKKIGVLLPARNTNLRIDDYHYLIQLTGPKEIKTAFNGYSRPILMELHQRSSFVDLEYLVRQASLFSSNNWRGFSHSPLPTSIYYANQIAKIVGLMESSKFLNSAFAMSPQLLRKVWFL